MFVTVAPENEELEHIVTGVITERGKEYWEVGCGHDHFPIEDFPEEELNHYEGRAADTEPKQGEFCRNCTNRVHTGLIFEMGD